MRARDLDLGGVEEIDKDLGGPSQSPRKKLDQWTSWKEMGGSMWIWEGDETECARRRQRRGGSWLWKGGQEEGGIE